MAGEGAAPPPHPAGLKTTMLIAQSFPTTAPSSWRDPAALPFVMACIIAFASGLAAVWAIVKGTKTDARAKVNTMRLDRHSEELEKVKDRQYEIVRDVVPPLDAPATQPRRPATGAAPVFPHTTETKIP